MNYQKYNISIENIYTRLMPYFYLRDESNVARIKFVELLKLIASSLQVTQQGIFYKCQSVSTFLSYTGNHMSLEAYLNDTYDATLRRITITENNVSQATAEVWYRASETDTEVKVWYTAAESDPDTKIWFKAEESGGGFNFTINMPLSVVFTEDVLRAQLKNYVLAGKRYDINII